MIDIGSFIGKWKSDSQTISLYRAANQFLANIQDQADTQTAIASVHIKCGILGTTPHIRLIQKIDQLGKETIKEHISVCCYPFQGQPTEVWVFEAKKGAALWIKKAKENLKQRDSEKEEKAIDCCQNALKNFKEALKLQKSTKGSVKELESVILYLEKELFLLQIERDLSLYLSSPEERAEFNEVIETYKAQENIFSELSEYLKACEEPNLSCQLFLSALMDEHFNRPTSAIQNYLRLAEHHSDPLPCFKKAEELVKQIIVSDPFAVPHFLEKLDGTRLIKLRQTTHYPEDLERLILQKDAVRMTFEKCLATLNQHSPQTKAPTCFICFNDKEADVGKWLEQVFVPDLDHMGIQSLFCFRDLNPGPGDLSNFQSLIRGTDQVIVVCTPNLKRICEERKKNPTGVAQEIRLTIGRYNDSDKYETIFLLYLKGDRKESCPSEFFESIEGSKLNESQETSVLSYYANAFEFLGGMRNIPRETSRKIKENFLLQANKILAGEINQEELKKWRQEKQSQIERVLKEAQERVTKMTQIVHLPMPPKDFTGRQHELQDLHAACQHHCRVAITGLGGVGKTALALKYANDHQTDYQFVYLIPAGTSQLIKDGLLQLADDLHIPKIEKIEERLQLLKRRLNLFEQKYLLIVDGIDQVEAFDELNKYLPERGNCLLLTSRMPEQSRIRDFKLIELKPFSLEDAVNYLLQATSSEDKEKAGELAERLGKLPLALTHAAGYIRSRKISLHEYIQEFDQFQLKLFEDRQLDLLTKEEKTILTTWNISLNAIETVNKCPLAKEVMAFFAFLGQAPISLNLIKGWFKTVHPTNEELEVGNALRHLCGYSMIDSHSPDFYQVHALVQQVTHYQMTNPQQVFEQAFTTLNLQVKKFKEKDVNTWSLTKPVIPHALSLFEKRELMTSIALQKQEKFMSQLGNICQTYGNFNQALEVSQGCLKVAKQWHKQYPQFQKTSKALLRGYNHIGKSLDSLGKYDEALENHQKGLEICLKMYGENHSDVATSHNNIGLSLDSLGKYDEALEYYRKALEIKLKMGEEELPDVALSYNNIGSSLQSLGKYDEALEYSQKALEIKLKVYGESHPDVATSYNNIGGNLDSLGKYDEALEYYRKALEIWLKVYGENHPKVAISYNNIGLNLESLGKCDEALEYKQKGLEIWLKVYGKSHPDVATSYNNIGLSLDSLGKYDEALKYHRKSLEIKLKVYGDKPHPDVAKSYNNIGSSLDSLGKYDEALKYYRKALKIMLKVYGQNHPDVARSYNNIGSSLESLGKYDEALKYHQKSLEIWLKVYGQSHPDVAISYNNIGLNLESLGKCDEALEYYRKALEIWLKVYGEKHPNVAQSYNNIGSSLQSLGKYDEALKYHQKSLEIRLKAYGEKHPDVALSHNNTGSSLDSLGKYDEALEFYRKSLEIRLKVYGENHPVVAISYNNIGSSLNSLGKYNEALEFYRKSLEIKIKVYGEKHPNVATSYNNIGLSLKSLGKYDEALELYRKSLEIWLKVYGENHPAVARSYNNIGGSLQSLGKYDEALEYYRKSLEIKIKVYGDKPHPDVSLSYNNIGSNLESLGKFDEALEYHRKALEISLKVYGQSHSDVAASYNNIGSSSQRLGKYDEAAEYYQKALEIWLKVYGENHPDLAASYNNIGLSLKSLGKYDKALEYYRKALEIWLKVYGENHPDVATSYNNIGTILQELRKYDEAFDYHYKALKVYEKIYPSFHYELIQAKQNLNAVLKKMTSSLLSSFVKQH